MPIKRNFDELDYLIILELHQDARRSASEIARKLSANERTIRKRIDRLIESGAVRMSAVINPAVFGYITTVDVFLEADPDQEKVIIEHLLEMHEITYIAFNQGERDISIEARFKDNEEMREFLRYTLPSIPGLKVKEYTLLPKILRNIDEWLPQREDFSAGMGDEP
jgi:DNA-binding Lrp family transcriptional regulator